MNLRLIFCVGMGVFTTFMGLLMLAVHFRTPVKYELPPKPNFKVRSEEVVDATTGDKTIYREITVSTKLTKVPVAVPVVKEEESPPAVVGDPRATAPE